MIEPDISCYGRQASRVRRYTSCAINCIRSVTVAFVVLSCSIELASAQAAVYQSLLESVQSPEIGLVEFPSLKWWKSTAQTLLTYCESVVSRIPWKSPSDVSLETEDNADVLAMPFEFSRGQLMIIFSDCMQFTHEIQRTRVRGRELPANQESAVRCDVGADPRGTRVGVMEQQRRW